MYLISMSAQQVSAAVGGKCRVLIEWTYGNQEVDVIELRFTFDSTGTSYLLAHLPVEDETDPVQYEVELLAPAGGIISVCPRLIDDKGVLEDMQPDDDDQDHYWEAFCLEQHIMLEGREEPGRQGCQLAPEITLVEVGAGTITVRWTDPEGYDEFQIDWRHGGMGSPARATTKDRHFVLERAEGNRVYQFRVRGLHLGISRDCASPWSGPAETHVSPEDGYVPPRFPATASIAAVSRDSDFMDLFLVGPDGTAWSAWWNGGWHMWFQLGQVVFLANSPLTALSRDTDFMDVFGVGYDGRVWVAWWNGNPWRDWTPLGEALFDPGAPVAALSRDTDFMDLFAVGRDGRLYGAWWNGNPWRPWFAFDGASFTPGSPVAALSRHSDHMELFVVDLDGVVRGAWWNGQWRGWYALPGEVFPQGTPIAAVSRHEDHMEIYLVGGDGVVRGNWWDGEWHGWFRLDGQTFDPLTPIAALSRDEGHMEVLLVRPDGQVFGNWWIDQWRGWFHLGGEGHEHLAFLPPIAAISRDPDYMDVFVISREPGREFVWSNWWRASWRRWFPVI